MDEIVLSTLRHPSLKNNPLFRELVKNYDLFIVFEDFLNTEYHVRDGLWSVSCITPDDTFFLRNKKVISLDRDHDADNARVTSTRSASRNDWTVSSFHNYLNIGEKYHNGIVNIIRQVISMLKHYEGLQILDHVTVYGFWPQAHLQGYLPFALVRVIRQEMFGVPSLKGMVFTLYEDLWSTMPDTMLISKIPICTWRDSSPWEPL